MKENKRKIFRNILIGAVSLTVLTGAGVYFAGVKHFEDKFFPNTFINGMDVSRLSVESVDRVIGKKIEKYSFVIHERGGRKEKITSSQIGYHYVPGGEVQSFMDSQNAFLWPVSFWQEYRYKFGSDTAYDKAKLKETVENLECLKPENIVEPKDAYLKFETATYEIEKEVEGNQLNKKKLMAALKSTIGNHEKQVSLEKAGCYEAPAKRSDDETLNGLVKNLNQYCQTRIEYQFGKNTEVLDGSVIHKWVTFDESGNVTFDEEQVRSYVISLAEKYDTYNKVRNLKTNDGSTVEVRGGSYGWMLDQEQEIQELAALIKVGANQQRTALFAQTAVSWENSDLGNSYVEIDLTKQHLWMYVDGQVLVSSDFVSGSMVKEGCSTPSGTYTLYYKKSPDVLKSDKPGDSYQTPVTYWMPFNGGVGMHDANWRGSFGGSIYVYNGSHGCINLPPDAARQIYENIYDGFPIICFYR